MKKYLTTDLYRYMYIFTLLARNIAEDKQY